MRIGTKLLLTYLALIGFVGVVVVTALPRWVESAVIATERERLQKQAENLARDLGNRSVLRRLGGLQPPIALLEDLLVDDYVAIVNERCVVLRSTHADLQGKQICQQNRLPQHRQSWLSLLPEIPGIGRALVVTAPLQNEALPKLQIAMLRDITFIRKLAQPITRRITFIIGLVLCAALLVSGWISREMVGRLRATGGAAKALAEGNLAQRAPLKGNDEITELAGHFNHMAERLQLLVEGLQRSERLRKELLVTVSHELRTPMTSIAGFAEALRDGIVPEQSQKQRYYQIIANEAARLNRLINDVFDMAKLEAGQMELRLQAISVPAWLVEFAEGFLPVAQGSDVRLDLQISADAERARIYGDRDRLDQVLGNLLGNAVRYSPKGEAITLRARNIEGDVIIAVTDHGPGLKPEQAGRVFERFYRGSNKGEGHTGAGLGLAIVKSLVEAHGGSVGVESTPGMGATFWFRLKRIDT